MLFNKKFVAASVLDTIALLSRVTKVSPVQPEKAYVPILVTLSGMVTSVSSVQFPKA